MAVNEHYREVGMDQPAFRIQDKKHDVRIGSRDPRNDGQSFEQDVDGNGSIAMQDIVQAERQLIIETFERLKQRGDGELRVSTRRNPRTKLVEIIYCGAHEKSDLAPVRRLYEAVTKKTVTF